MSNESTMKITHISRYWLSNDGPQQVTEDTLPINAKLALWATYQTAPRQSERIELYIEDSVHVALGYLIAILKSIADERGH